MASILEDFSAAVKNHPDRVAIIDGKGKATSFKELKARADGLACMWQKRGIKRGDRVLLAMKLDADLYAGLAALWTLGATVVLPEPAMGIAGLRHAAQVTKASAFCSSGLYGLLKFVLPELRGMKHLRPVTSTDTAPSCPPPAGADIALISFTSGTTGRPKAIPRSHDFLTAQHHAIAPLLQSDGAERDLVAFPVFVLINIASGRSSVLPSWKMSRLAKLQTSTLEQWIKSQEITRALLPPSLCEKLVGAQISDPFHTVFTGGGPIFPDLVHRMQASCEGLRVICVYGSTEAEPIAHLDGGKITADELARMEAGQGLLVGDVVSELRVRIVEDEILVAGAHVNNGYLNPDHDAENKVVEGTTIWHRTGDTGYFDDHGRLWLLGRSGSQVDIEGDTIYPFSVEVAARQWKGVDQCAFIPNESGARLVIEGDIKQIEMWRRKAAAQNITEITHLTRIPMDKRHASKIDRAALMKLRLN